MIFDLVWVPVSCEFFDNDSRAVLTELAANADMPVEDPRAYGPYRVQTYEGENWDLTDETWSFQTVGYPTEAASIEPWVAVMEAPIEP